MKISVIILNYKTPYKAVECANNILRQDYKDYNIIIVDNNSGKGNVEVIKKELNIIEPPYNEAKDSKNIILIRNEENLGYSAGNNIGIKMAMKLNAEAVLIINPDVEIKDNYFLRKLVVPFVKYKKVGISAPMVIDHLGRNCNPLREPSGIESILGVTFVPILKRIKIKIDDRYVVSIENAENNYIKAEKVHGCCLMLGRELLNDIGYLDEHNFMYCEEAILAQQLKMYEYDAYVCVNAIAKHIHTTEASLNNRIMFFESRKYFLKKYKPYNVISTKILFVVYNIIIVILRRK